MRALRKPDVFGPPLHPERHPLLGHRCYERELVGRLTYDPIRTGRERPLVAVIDFDDEFAVSARAWFKRRHGIELDPPEFGFHMSVFRGPIDRSDAVERLWGHLDGALVRVQLTNELFWKGRCVWANAHCPEYDLLRHTLGGLDSFDSETWGHATIGTFPPGFELPRFLDYRDILDWGFRP